MLNQSATRYVKKVSANPEMSHNKLLSRIKRNSDVLEFGPASGAMTKVMYEEMDCRVSIVEIDRDCFADVMKYAEDGVCDNIENFNWLDKFRNKKFDYIIFADVLEHLLKPDVVLERVKELLKDDGSILISVPNIAHNSVIIQLLKNQFVYQSTGILDFTHVRHFTFSEIERLCMDSGYGVVYMDGVYIAVGKNEFNFSYEDVEPEVAEILKKRPLGELYQHILEIKKSEFVEINDIKIENCLSNLNGYASLFEEEIEEKALSAKGVNADVIRMIYSNPNQFFVNNNEIARLRLELNELYLASTELTDVMELKNRIQSCNDELRMRGKRIVELQNGEEERNNHIQYLDSEIERKDARIQELQAEVENIFVEYRKVTEKIIALEELKRKEMETLEKRQEMKLAELEQSRKAEIETHEKQQAMKLAELEQSRKAEIEVLEKRQAMKLAELEQSRKAEIEVLEKRQAMELAELERSRKEEIERFNSETSAEIASLRQEIRNKEGHIELLLEVEREYEREKNSRTYKMALIFRKISTTILPVNSKRRFFAKLLGKAIKHPSLMIKMINPRRIKNCFTILKTEGVDSALHHLDLVEKFERSTDVDTANLQVTEVVEDNKTIADYERLVFTKHKKPLVSIIIPVYNQFDYTYHCLESILKNSGDVPYEIIIGNDCSTDLTTDIKKVVDGITVINNKNNLRFLLNCNNAAKYANGEYILFLNNDTQVQENWLQPLIDLMNQDEKIGMVGSKLVYSDGYLQEAGGIFWNDASAWNYGNRQNPADPEYNYVKDADYISGASIMIRHKLWKEIGGFDERFVPAYYEDSDLAFEVRKHGYRVVYQPLSVVVHFEGVSNGTDLSSGQKAYQVTNQQKFYEKWKDVLEKDHYPNAENVFLAKDRSRYKKQILVVDHYVPHHDKDAGGKCTYMYLKLFVQMGFKVTFIGDNFFKHEPYTTELNQMGIEVLYGNYYYNNWQEWLKQNLHYFDYIYLQRPHISIKYIDLVKEYGRGKILYFAHDLHHVRERREYELTGDIEKLKSAENWEKIEMELFEKTDVGHVVGNYEQNVMQEKFPGKPIRNIPLYIYDAPAAEINKNFAEREDLMYVGGFGHAPNIDAVLWFGKEVFPKIVEKYPNMKWHVVGSKVPKEIEDLASDNIIIEGFLTDEELEKLYRTCRMDVVPLRVGAGVKGKVVEAAYYQIPLVTTSIGAEGLDAEMGNMVVEDDATKMAELICNLYEDTSKLKEMSDAGASFIERYFTTEEAERVIKLDIQ